MEEKNSKAFEDKPPVLGSWRNFYKLVIGVLLLLIAVFYGITQYYA